MRDLTEAFRKIIKTLQPRDSQSHCGVFVYDECGGSKLLLREANCPPRRFAYPLSLSPPPPRCKHPLTSVGEDWERRRRTVTEEQSSDASAHLGPSCA